MPERTEHQVVAGIGASAGGLEALRQLLPGLPDDEDIAYVIVQHVDGSHKSLMVQLLADSTAMPVSHAHHEEKVEKNHVYVTPPGAHITMRDGMLILDQYSEPSGPTPSIDRFFLSLAEEKANEAIGVILSGTGSDGAVGMRAIKAAGGLTAVQHPQSAKYDGMPRSAIAAANIDIVATPEVLGAELSGFAGSPYVKPSASPLEIPGEELRRVLALLRTARGHDFSQYKVATIHRRIWRRITLHKLGGIREYLALLEGNETEIDALYKDILISVTRFFRDRQAFSALDNVIGDLVRSRKDDDAPRVWVPGCATGEEAYSIALLFAKHTAGDPVRSRGQFYATDIDLDSLAIARHGIYPASILGDVSDVILKQYFTQDDGAYRIRKAIRESIVFAKQDVIGDPPFSRLDLIACRNLLIYFEADLQEQIIAKFHYSLRPGGILFLGKSESVGPLEKLFSPIDKKWRIFRRREVPRSVYRGIAARHDQFLRGYSPPRRPVQRIEPSFKQILDQTSGVVFAPPSILINDKMQLLHVGRGCGSFLSIGEGDSGMDVLGLVDPAVRSSLHAAIEHALRKGERSTSRCIRFGSSDAAPCYVSLHVAPVAVDGAPPGLLLVSFEPELEVEAVSENDSGVPDDARVTQLEKALAATEERLETSVEDIETTNEELQSLNEELQSANEELQSTNEELETSNEELQATNEELTTVNQELFVRTEELAWASADLENVFKRMGLPLIVVDRDLNIRRFTPQATTIFAIMPGDKRRSILHLPPNIDIPDFRAMLDAAIEKGEPATTLVEVGSRYFDMKLYPYYDEQESINGALVSFYDVTAKHEREQAFESLVENAQDIVARFDLQLRHVYLNKAAERYTGRPREEFIGKTNRELGMPAKLCDLWERETRRVEQTRRENSFKFELATDAGTKFLESRVVPEFSPGGTLRSFLCITRDVTEAEAASIKLAATLSSINDGFMTLDDDLTVTYFNDAASQLLGRSPREVIGRNLLVSFPEAHGSIFEQRYREAIEKREKQTFEVFFDEEPYRDWYDVRVYPMADGISVFFKVITEQKEAERRVEHQKALLQSIFDTVPLMITVYDPHVDVLLVNKCFEDTVGWSKSELAQVDIMEVCYPDPDTRQAAAAFMAAPGMGWRDFPLTTRQGDVLETRWTNAQLGDGTRVGIGLDVTESKCMEALLHQKKKLESLGTLAGGIAHDFNNCLASILGFTEVLLDKQLSDTGVHRGLESIQRAAIRARDLIRQILTFSQTAPPKGTLFSPVKVAEETLEMLQATLPPTIIVKTHFPTQDLVLCAAETQFYQVLMNLCTNAVHAMSGGGTLSISIASVSEATARKLELPEAESKAFLKLSVSDTGMGIPAEDHERLFDPYFTRKNTGGSGLGLAVVHGVVSAQGGLVQVTSAPGEGATFDIYLPLADSELPPSQPDSRARAQVASGEPRVLAVDDEKNIAELYVDSLGSLGYRVIAFTDPKEALAHVRNDPGSVDIVITDMTMPGMLGDELAREIKSIRPDLPIILTTGHSPRTNDGGPESLSVDAILMKPARRLDLSQKIQALLADRGEAGGSTDGL